MSDSVTPQRPTAPTAAELRERFVDEWNTREHWDSGGVRMGADLDALVAAVRAEALGDAATLAEIYVGLSARAARVPRAIRALVSK